MNLSAYFVTFLWSNGRWCMWTNILAVLILYTASVIFLKGTVSLAAAVVIQFDRQEYII